MKAISPFEDTILDSSETIKRIGLSLINNMGKLIALLVTLVAVAVTFTDVTFSSILTADFASSFLLLITSAYIIYFSLEDAGEKCAEETPEYKEAKAKYAEQRKKILADDIESFREYLAKYSEREHLARIKNALFTYGISQKSVEDYKNGICLDKKTSRAVRAVLRIKPIIITPKAILSHARAFGRSELENPEKRKIPMLLLKLIPPTICMTVTVSVMLTTKDGLTASDIISGILKLSALPLIGFRGYSEGYSFAKHRLSLWMETKANIIEGFIDSAPEDGNGG